MSSRVAWLASVAGLTVAGTGLMIGAPYMLAGGVAGALITGVGAAIEDKRIEKQMRMFRSCEIYIKKGSKENETYYYPTIISSDENYMLIDLPAGMGIKGVADKVGAIEHWYGKKVLIGETSNKKVVIRLLNPSGREEDRWLSIFSDLGLIGSVGDYPSLIYSELNQVGQKVTFSLPHGMTLDDFTKKRTELEGALKCKIDISYANYNLTIQSITKDFKDSYTIDFKNNLRANMEFLIGVGRGDAPLTVDLGGNEFSTLVCGSSGSGKSVFLNCLMVQMILKDVEIRAIDLKAVEFKIFKNYKNMVHYATDRKTATEVLADTFTLMQERYRDLEEKSCKSYADYNKKHNNAMHPVLLIIDEFSALMGNKQANFFLFELLSRARASNILVVICTQTPRAKVLDTTIRCNIKNTICFSCETDTDSEVALGQKGNFRACRELNKVGRGFLKSKKELIEFQGYYLTDEQIENQIAHKMGKSKPTEVPATVESEKVVPISKNKKKTENIIDVLEKIDAL